MYVCAVYAMAWLRVCFRGGGELVLASVSNIHEITTALSKSY